MKYMLVVQWRKPALSFDRLIEMEESVTRALKESRIDCDVDGHDVGSNECNLFVHTNQPNETFDVVLKLVKEAGEESGLASAYRPLKGSNYTVLWPRGSASFKVS